MRAKTKTVLGRDTTAKAVAGMLRDEIQEGGLAPGTRLRQNEVAKRFGVSTTPVREAFAHGRWKSIDRKWWGNEAWPGLHWPAPQGGIVFKSGYVPDLDCYELRKMFERYIPEFREWCKANAERRTEYAV